jgi:hypothetical protein
VVVKQNKKGRGNLTTERHPAGPHHCSPLAVEFYPFPSQRTDAEVDDRSIIGDYNRLDGAGSHILILWSSEHDANMRSFVGFQATALTLPSPWPVNTSKREPVSRCHMYTFPSEVPKFFLV